MSFVRRRSAIVRCAHSTLRHLVCIEALAVGFGPYMPHPDTRRNDPCPCGSGRRYKDCHGVVQNPIMDSVAALARDHLARGSIAEAERSARQAIERDSADAEAWTVLGLTLEANQPDAARAAWEKAVALAPRSPEAHFRLGDFHRRRGEHTRAIASYESSLA